MYSTEAGMTNYLWTINGGTITSGQGTHEITVSWTTAGSRWLRVSYTGANGCDPVQPIEYSVTVNPLPVPVISGPNTPCMGDAGNVYTTVSGMINYVWNISAGGTITGGGGTSDNTVTVTWNSTGVQWVSLIYTDINGCTNTTAIQYFVNVSSPTLTGPMSPCLGTSTNVYTTELGMTNYVWTVTPGGTIISGGTSSSNTATIQWNLTGAQTVTINYTSSSGCATAAPTSLNVNVLPLPNPTLNGDNDVCEYETGVVYTTESGMSLYDWTISAGGTITSGGTSLSNTVTVTWNTAGAQTVSVNYTNANGCTAENATVYPITVHAAPVPTITGSNSECQNSTGVVYTTESGQLNYDWNISGGTITSGAGTNSVTVTWTNVGSQWISVNYSDSNGCDSQAPTQYPITVLALPVPTINGSNSVCVNATSIEYTTQIGMTNYQWTVPSGGTIVGSSTNYNVFVNWNTIGSHNVEVIYTSVNGCDANAPVSYNVTVNSLPTPSLSGSFELCNNSTGNVYTTEPGMSNYSWTVTGGTITSGGGNSD